MLNYRHMKKTYRNREEGHPDSGGFPHGGHCPQLCLLLVSSRSKIVQQKGARALGSDRSGFKPRLSFVTVGKLPDLSDSRSLISEMEKAAPPS